MELGRLPWATLGFLAAVLALAFSAFLDLRPKEESREMGERARVFRDGSVGGETGGMLWKVAFGELREEGDAAEVSSGELKVTSDSLSVELFAPRMRVLLRSGDVDLSEGVRGSFGDSLSFVGRKGKLGLSLGELRLDEGVSLSARSFSVSCESAVLGFDDKGLLRVEGSGGVRVELF